MLKYSPLPTEGQQKKSGGGRESLGPTVRCASGPNEENCDRLIQEESRL
jgi:hypothetical protein